MKRFFTPVLIAPMALIALFGAGCFRVAPRITKAPNAVPVAPAVSQTAQTTPSSGIAYIHLEDNAKASLFRDGETVDAVENAELSGGDRVVVSEGEVDLVYPDAGVSQLEKGTDVTLVADPSQSGFFTEVRLAAGGIWTRFEKLFDAGEHFSVSANGVVATVRGTAFGVTVNGTETDVQVADHTVDVSREDATVPTAQSEQKIVRVEAGQGVKLSADVIATLPLSEVRARVRALTEAERGVNGFRFAMVKRAQQDLKRPDAPVRLFRVAPQLNTNLKLRLQILRQLDVLRAGFATPLRGVLQQDQAPTSLTPSVTGPTQ